MLLSFAFLIQNSFNLIGWLISSEKTARYYDLSINVLHFNTTDGLLYFRAQTKKTFALKTPNLVYPLTGLPLLAPVNIKILNPVRTLFFRHPGSYRTCSYRDCSFILKFSSFLQLYIIGDFQSKHFPLSY